jgi:signal transduction histidine kinase
MTFERSKILPGAGLAVFGIVGIAEVARVIDGPTSTRAVVVVCIALAVFAVAFITSVGVERLGTRGRAAAVAAQSLAALAIVAEGRGGFAPALLVVIAGQAPMMLPTIFALACVATQTIALAVIATLRWGATGALLTSGSWLGFQLFALGAAHLAQREWSARRELSRVHAELLATHAMLADSARVAERLRISRELHDALGHHLAALSLQLEVARNVAEGRALEPVDAAHAIAKQLLAELREVVGAMRSDEPLDLAGALRLLVAGVPHPEVHLALPSRFEVCDASRAHAIFRCVQEALTNTILHARAENVWIELTDDGERLAIVVRDDGCGVETMKPGVGLSGLRERVEGLGGRVEIDSSVGRGLTLRAFLPARSSP